MWSWNTIVGLLKSLAPKAHHVSHEAGGSDVVALAGGDMTKAVYDTNADNRVDVAAGLYETGGPTTLTVGAIVDGQFLKRSGNTIVSAAAGGTGLFVPRNTDAAAYDYLVGSFIIDSLWHDLDLSAIVPAGAIAVLVLVALRNTTVAGATFVLRRNGNANAVEVGAARTQVANIILNAHLVVSCDANRVIEYYVQNTGTWDTVSLHVLGWWV